jgi:hypothetical protein
MATERKLGRLRAVRGKLALVPEGELWLHQPKARDDLRRALEISPLKTEVDYRAALQEIEALMMVERDTPEGKRLDELVTLVEAYESFVFRLVL